MVVNCGGKNFSANTQNPSQDDDDNIVIDDQDDGGDGEVCPRYDLVITSTHTTNKKLNFKYTFNGEMTFTAIKSGAEHKIQFTNSKFSSCSGNYTNTTIQKNLVPLQALEDLTGTVLITTGAACVTSPRITTIKVIDGANGNLLYDESEMRDQLGCEYGYTTDGQALRTKLLNLADGVANAKGAACE